MDNKAYNASKEELRKVEDNMSPVSVKKQMPLPPISPGKEPQNGKVGHHDEESGEGAQTEEEPVRTPFFYARWIVKYPKICFFTTLGMHLFFLLLVIIISAAGVNIVPIEFERLPLDITDNVEYLRGLAWQERDTSKIYDRSSTGDVQTERTDVLESIEWFFEKPGGNVLKKKHFRDMKKAEDKLWEEDEFQNEFCWTTDGSTCRDPRSILRLFDGTYSDINSTFSDPNYENINEVLTTALEYPVTNGLLDYVLGKGAVIRSDKVKVSIVRGSMSVGAPLDGFDKADEKIEKQQDEFKKYANKKFIKLATKIYEKGAGNMDFYFASPSIISEYISSTVFTDIALAIGSLCFIFFFMWFQTRSLFITTFAIYSIVNGFLITDVIYIGILQIKYLGVFHVLSLFIVLGIGADDVFVFMDTWTEASHKAWPSVEHRLDHTFRHAGLAMMYTSLTTAVAFFVSAASPFLAVNSFGVFSGLLVVFNYFSVVIFFPTCVIMYHTYFVKYKCCCCCPVVKTGDDDVPAKKNIIVRFFAGPYYRFITHKILRWVILGGFLVLIAVTVYFSTTIEINEEQLKFLPTTTNIGAYLEKDAEEFGTGEFPQRVFIMWGLKEQDLSKCDPSNSECYGKTRFNSKLNLENRDVQQALWDFCEDIRTLSSSKIKDLEIKVNSLTGEPEVNCFVDEIKDFLEEDEDRMPYDPDTATNALRYPANTNLGYPVNESVVTTIMDNVDYIYDSSALDADFDRYFEIAMSYWLYDGFQLDNETEQAVLDSQFAYYSPLLGVSEESYTVDFDDPSDYLDFTYKYGTRLRYMAITVNLTINPLALGFPTGLPIRDKWEKWVSGKMKDMPSELKDGFQTTPPDYVGFNLWHWLYVQESLAVSAAQGIIIGLGIAFPILVIATMNVIVGFFATATIGLITLTVLAFIPIAGWKLGVLESLNLVLVVGLSVDYCVHLAEGYSRCKKPDRLGRVQSALEEVGVSVISGALTTLGASFFLMLAVIIFFLRFGIFMFVTIGFSCIYSLGLFMTLLGLIGPQNEFGSLWPLFNKIKKRCCSKKE